MAERPRADSASAGTLDASSKNAAVESNASQDTVLPSTEQPHSLAPHGASTSGANADRSEVSSLHENTPESTEAQDAKESIKLTHLGKKKAILAVYRFPWTLCNTFEGLQRLLNKQMGQSASSLWAIETYQYKLRTKDGSQVIRDAWEGLAEPGWEITFQFSRDEDRPPPLKGATRDPTPFPLPPGAEPAPAEPEPEEPEGITYDDTVAYSLRYYTQQFSYEKPHFDYEEECKGPVIFEREKAANQRLPVLKEAFKIIRTEGGKKLRPQRRSSFESIVSYDSSDEAEAEAERQKTTLLRPGDVIDKRHLTIHSSFLLNALRSVMKYTSDKTDPSRDAFPDPGQETDPDVLDEGVFEQPYKDLFLHIDDLREYQKSHPSRDRHSPEDNASCDRHIKVMIDFLYNQEQVRYKHVEERWARQVPTITFDSVWLLLKPGTDVILPENGVNKAYVVESVVGGRNKSGRVTPYVIMVWNLEFDGNVITRRSKIITLPIFDGEREIIRLPIYPIRFHDDELQAKTPLRDRLIARGKKYVQFAKGPIFMEYTGTGLKHNKQKYEKARCVIDHKRDKVATSHRSIPMDDLDYDEFDPLDRRRGRDDKKIGARARIPSCQCEKCVEYNADHQIYTPLTFGNYDQMNPRDDSAFDDHKYLLCSSHLYGFVLKDRLWDLLDVDHIQEPHIDKHAIDKLVMKPESNKRLIKAICEAYTTKEAAGKPYFTDYIQGKGEGQIFLLHGPPGTGKTLTAESVAEFTKRPLLSITAADLGHEPVQLERNLLTFFRDATDWDAIVLLDEADVYLERRGTDDLMRNSVVSIFLHALDYFAGILFLTTNRVGLFDEAFKSRIHVQIGYDKLDEAARQQIWENNFNKLAEDSEERGRLIRTDTGAKEYVQESKELQSLQWNGREIRNAFQTAVALALFECKEHETPRVRESHLKQVVKMSKAFKEYVKATQNDMDDSEMAFKSGTRDDTKRHN